MYIAIEGLDGAGKTTVLEAIREYLEKEDIKHIFTREPGGCKLSNKIRELILNEDMHPITEAYLYASSRAEALRNIVMPALERKDWVISDRSIMSSMAYQGAGRDIGINQILEINNMAVGFIMPDLIIYIDVPVEVALERIKGRKLDRIEQEDVKFFKRTRKGFLEQWLVNMNVKRIDGTLSEKEVARKAIKIIEGWRD